jgi:hypothetical protein
MHKCAAQVLALSLMQLHMLRRLAEVSSTSSHWGEQEHHGMHWGEALRGHSSAKVAVLSLLSPAAMQVCVCVCVFVCVCLCLCKCVSV